MKEDYRAFLVSACNVDDTLREAFEAGYLAGQASTKGTVSDAAEIKLLHERVKELETDINEQCRLNGMGSEREARLMARVEELEGDCAILRHAYADQLKAQAGVPVMPAYGQIPWKDLIASVGEAQGCAWEPDDSYYIGHQPVQINMNSLNRIVSKFATRTTTERRAIPEDVRKAMEMALSELEADGVYGLDHVAIALRNALNAAPKESK